MVDVGISGMTSGLKGVGAGVSKAASVGAYAIMVIVVLGVIAFLIWHYKRMKSFNQTIVIKRTIGDGRGFEFEMGHRGRYVFKTNLQNEKEMQFEIYNAKKFKLNYNNEPVDRQYRIPILSKGRRGYMIIMQPDNEGFLHPVSLTETEKNKLIAFVGQADIAYAQKEIENSASKYLDDKDFMKKYGMIIYIVLVLIIAILYWWGTKNNAASTHEMVEAVKLFTSSVAKPVANTTAPVVSIIG